MRRMRRFPRRLRRLLVTPLAVLLLLESDGVRGCCCHASWIAMDVDARHGSILAMAAVGVGVCWCRNQPAAGDTAAASATASEAPAARDVLWGPATPREPTVTSGNTPRKVVQPPGTPSRGTPQDQLWGQSGSEGRPSPRPTRTMLSRRLGSGSAAATAIAGVARASHKLYIGCYSEKQWWVEGQPGEGLYVFDFDAETGGLALDEIERTVVSPSWSAVHPTGKFLFVVTEKGPDDKETDSFVTCYSIGETGTLTYISKQLTGGLGGNCITVVGDSAVVCTNYFTGSLASFPFNPQTGVLGSATVTPHVQAATGPIADRQEGAHPHDLYVKGSQLFVPDLGMDQVLGYAVDSATGAPHRACMHTPARTLCSRYLLDRRLNAVVCVCAFVCPAKLTPLPSGAPSYQSSPGSGCRGIQPHPMLSDTIYLISELDGSLAVLRLPADGSGKLTEIQSGVKTYPPSAPVRFCIAAPSPRYCYATCRNASNGKQSADVKATHRR